MKRNGTMTRMTPLLERNEQFARTYSPAALGLPTAQVVVVACLDHRVDPAIVYPQWSRPQARQGKPDWGGSSSLWIDWREGVHRLKPVPAAPSERRE
jgi:hypothetical protein